MTVLHFNKNATICKVSYHKKNVCAAVEILEKVNSTHIKLMVDLYHLQHIKGNITNTIRDLMPLIGHIQVKNVWFLFFSIRVLSLAEWLSVLTENIYFR